MTDAWATVRTPEDLGRFLARTRTDRGLTQEALAGELGVSRRYVSEIENGKPGLYTERLFQQGYPKLSLKKYKPIAARNEDAKVSRGLR
jgi:HTH-type transcriptional regulator/antitoxin HipB